LPAPHVQTNTAKAERLSLFNNMFASSLRVVDASWLVASCSLSCTQ